ncbi:hypothetical protein PPACK8108_LOCUS12436 [Phakopsora pachyrhizi]|uniref:Uncharacterized protein n=1 Tax=Phakopsora pachyrhizi TaxID=170000 RepID=A0AAV0B3W7_PHAPC|nr:hypothetical protein PPACK8108_LOCUS12436 [Phakopsora pachyrhizi]
MEHEFGQVQNHMSEEDKEREAAEDPRQRAVDTGCFEEIKKSLERKESRRRRDIIQG